MGRIWSDQRRYETWLLVETAAADAMAARRPRAAEAAREIRERGGFDIARIEEIEQITQHDVIAFTTGGRRESRTVGTLAPFRDDLVGRDRHAQALQMREACDILLTDLDGARRRDSRIARSSIAARQ